MNTYVFDQAWQKERDRLTAIESLFDPASRRLLTDLGVAAGWKCLEVGCGAGSVALWLADRVGASGRVLATDLDPRHVDARGRANLEVRTHDIVTDPLDEDGFDLIHARAVLIHVPDRQHVLKRLVAALRPGGRLLIEDVDFGGATAAMLAQYVTAPEPAPAAMGRIYQAFAAVFAAKGADPSYGTRLTGALVDAGLADVGAELHAPVPAGGSEQWTRGSVEQLAEPLLDTGLTTADDLELFLAFSTRPDVFYLPPLMVSAWGRRD